MANNRNRNKNKNKNKRDEAYQRARNFGFSSSSSLLQGLLDAIKHNRPLKLQLDQPLDDMPTYGEYHPSRWTSHELGAVVIPCNIKLICSYERKNGEVHSMATGPGGVLYTGSDSNNIRVWVHGQLSGGFKAKNGPNYALFLDTQGRLFAGNYDGAVRAWVKKNNTQSEHIIHTKIKTLPLLQDRLKVSFLRTKNRLMRKSDHLYWFSFPVTCISMSKDMKFLYTGSVDQSIKIWRLSDWKLIDCKVEHTDMVSAVAAECDDLVFSGSKDGSIIMWQRKEKTNGKGVIHSLTQILLSGTTSVNALMLTCSGTDTGTDELYAGLSDGKVMFWEESKSWLAPAVFSCHDKAVTCLAGSHGKFVFSGSEDGKIYAWRREPVTAIHSLITVLIDHQGPINCLAAQEDWEENDNETCILYSASKDKTLKTWRFADSALEEQQAR